MLKKTIDFIHLLPIYWAVSGLFIVNNGDKILVALIISSLVIKIAHCILHGVSFNITLTSNKLIILLLLCSIYASLKYYHNGYSSSEIRVLISTFLYTSISMPRKIRYKTLISFITASTLYISHQTINIIEIKHLSRGGLPLNAIPYANFLGLLAVISFYCFYISKSKTLSALSLLNFILLNICVILVDTRGTWLALISVYICIVALIFIRKKSWKLTIVSLLLFTSTSILSYPIVKDRIDNSVKEIKLLQEGNLRSSWGKRIQLWKVGYNIVKENPSWFGLGQTEHLKIIQNMFKEGKVDKTIAKFDNKNFHNSIIDRTVKYGFIGLILYLFSLAIPFTYGIKHLRSDYSPPLILMPVFIFVAGLSYVPLSHPGTYFLYLLTSIFLINKLKIDRTHA